MIKEKREEKKRKHFIECKTKTGSHSWDKKKKRSIKHRHQIHVHTYLFSLYVRWKTNTKRFCLHFRHFASRSIALFFSLVCLCFIFTFSCTLMCMGVFGCICGLFICYVGWLDRVTTVHLSMHTIHIVYYSVFFYNLYMCVIASTICFVFVVVVVVWGGVDTISLHGFFSLF